MKRHAGMGLGVGLGAGLSVAVLSAAALGGLAQGCAKDADYGVQPPTPVDPGPDVGPSTSTVGPKPVFGATRVQAVTPPAITGGTLILTHDGHAVASDPDRDQMYVVDLGTSNSAGQVKTLPLQAGDEPGRLVEDAAGRIHVALRRSGALLTIDPASAQVIARQQICGAPRGVAYDPSLDNVLVACATGELVTVPAAGGAAKVVMLERDLRDVIVADGAIYVSKLRNAELLTLTSDGTITDRLRPPQSSTGMDPAIAWRAIKLPASSGGGIAMVHQRARTSPVSTQPGGYGEGSTPNCDSSIVESTISTFTANSFAGAPASAPLLQAPIAAPLIPQAVLPVDVAVSSDGQMFALVAAGNGKSPGLPSLLLVQAAAMAMGDQGGCVNPAIAAVPSSLADTAQAVAVAFTAGGKLVVQMREPALLEVFDPSTAAQSNGPLAAIQTITLSNISREDTGHSIFHSNAGGFVACASCHAEGGDDGRAWTFDTSGARRTQSMRGTIAGTAPYHWDGDMSDLNKLSHEVFVNRMSGDELQPDQVSALQRWLFAVPAAPSAAVPDAAAVTRGQALFFDSSVGCNSCHAGPRLTNNATLDVGTGGPFQVPSLIGVGWRAPYLHDGRAATLKDRFDPTIGGGDTHGHTSGLTSAQVDDLVSFLETL